MRQHDVAKAIGGGLLGTLVQTLMVYGVAPVLGGQSIHVAVLRAHACAPGMLAHLLSGGVLFPLGYLWLSSQVFPGPPVLQGMLWAGLLWCTAEVILAPLLGAGVFSPALGGFPAALWALAGYLVYGATLGSIAGHQRLRAGRPPALRLRRHHRADYRQGCARAPAVGWRSHGGGGSVRARLSLGTLRLRDSVGAPQRTGGSRTMPYEHMDWGAIITALAVLGILTFLYLH
jgi:hypothetical protein